jgi:hypothetical protein
MRRLRFLLGDVVLSIGGAITSVALRCYPNEVVPPADPFFDEDASGDEMEDRHWAGLIILHAEAVHGCDHTAIARAGVGMSGPLGERAAS